MPLKRRHEEEEEAESTDRWLVSYSDMITVLMALFIVLYAMGQVDETKYDQLKNSLASGFGQSGMMLNERSAVLDSAGSAAMDPIAPINSRSGLTPEERELIDTAIADERRLRLARLTSEVDVEVERLDEVALRLKNALRKHGLQNAVRTGIDERGLVVSLISEQVVFQADLASLTERGREVIDTLAPVLAELPDNLQIDGHTNQVPVKPKYYASDWDLASARAITVLRYLHDEGGIPNKRLSASAYGQERPLVDPKKPGSQRLNKRVDIVVVSSLPAESRALLAQYGYDTDGTKEVKN